MERCLSTDFLSQFVMMGIMEGVGSKVVDVAGGNLSESLAVLPFIRLLLHHQTHSYGSQQEGKRKSRQIGEAGETVHHVIDGTCHNLCYKHKVSWLNSLLAVFLKKSSWWRGGRPFDCWHEFLSALLHFLRFYLNFLVQRGNICIII